MFIIVFLMQFVHSVVVVVVVVVVVAGNSPSLARSPDSIGVFQNCDATGHAAGGYPTLYGARGVGARVSPGICSLKNGDFTEENHHML